MGKKKLLNADLEVGDSVQLISMTDPYKIPSSMMGKVKFASNVQGSKIYGVEWKTPNGNVIGSLSLIDDINPETGKRLDNWFKIVDDDYDESSNEDQIEENFITLTKGQILKESKKKIPEEFVRLSELYNIAEIYNYLEALRISSIVNMNGSSPYLFMGRDRIYHQHYFEDFDSEERQKNYDYVLENSDKIKNMIIRGAYSVTGADNMISLERKVQRDATDLFYLYAKMKGGSKFMR
jgi:hypothetical protein